MGAPRLGQQACGVGNSEKGQTEAETDGVGSVPLTLKEVIWEW